MPPRKKKFDPFLYMGYMDDSESVANIEYKFELMEQKMKNVPEGQSEIDVAKSVFLETVSPTQVPIDVWFDLENYGEEEELYSEDDFEPGIFDGDDEIPRSRGMGRSRSRSGMNESAGPNFANFTQVDHLGSGIELWPDYKLRPIDNDLNSAMHQTEFPNFQCGISEEEFIRQAKECPIYTVPHLDSKSLSKIVGQVNGDDGTKIDAIIMDPPFEHYGWNHDRFYKFLNELKHTLGQTFFVIWADPQHLPIVSDVCEKLELKFCDSISCELLSPLGTPVSIPIVKGFKRETRMLIMYRTDDITRNDLAQQRIKDTGWGVAAVGGKTYNRYSMPMSAHKIIETMLPHRKNRNRTYVELWPSTFNRRKGWIMINEAEHEGEPEEDYSARPTRKKSRR